MKHDHYELFEYDDKFTHPPSSNIKPSRTTLIPEIIVVLSSVGAML